MVEKARRAREKDIDLTVGLDAVTAALLDQCCTIIIVSRCGDVVEIAKGIHERTPSTPVRVEVALVAARDKHLLDGYDYTHWIDEMVVGACRDEFDYRSKLPRAEVESFIERV